MADCKYCGQPAGFFRRRHSECEIKHKRRENLVEGGRKIIIREVSRAIQEGDKFEALLQKILEIEDKYFISSAARVEVLPLAWQAAADIFMSEGPISRENERKLMAFKNFFQLSQENLNSNGTMLGVTKSATLRDLLEDVIPQRLKTDDPLPVNLQKSEQVVWFFRDVRYFEDKTRKTYVGESGGFSVRIMKGLYYHSNSFAGRVVERNERVLIGEGLLVVTNKNIYFSSPVKSFRVPYQKIVTCLPYGDGFGIFRDAVSARAQFFVTGDGWFTFNLLKNLLRLNQ
jgi:hypothetical protein